MRTKTSTLIVNLLCFFIPTTMWAANVTTFEDIEFWIGKGANQSALVIDWDDNSHIDESLVWGYRWDDTATSEDLLLSIIEADNRLFGKISIPGPMGIRLYGLGYDLNDDCRFAIDDDTEFDEQGFVLSGVPDANTNTNPAAHSTDSTDLYAEGWANAGYWRHGISNAPFDGGEWTGGAGLADQVLVDGSWDSWTFTPSYSDNAIAENPVAADSPSLSADFNLDNDVDGHDFLVWQQGFGTTNLGTHDLGDANHDCAVDGADLQIWQANFDSIASSTSTVRQIPEPSTAMLVFTVLFLLPVFLRKRIVS